MTMWFRYERDFARRWVPVVYHDDKPKQTDVERQTVAIEVSPGCIRGGEPMFGQLVLMFPAPREVEE